MAKEDISNWQKGHNFELHAKKVLTDFYEMEFEHGVKIDIGKPSKSHEFDLASEDGTIIVECKACTWTVSGNIPSAKLTTIDQALWYFSFLSDCTCIVILKKEEHSKRDETLAEYYVRSHGHLLRGVKIFELDEDDNIREISL